MAGKTYKWVSEQRLLYFTQKLKQHFPSASDFIDDTTSTLLKAYSSSKVDALLADKVDVVAGKGLSTEDFTAAYKKQLDDWDLTGLIDDTTTTATDKTWSASKIAQAIAAVSGIEFIKPEGGVLPAEGKSGAIYLIPNQGTAPNVYDEYIWIKGDPTGSWEKIGTTEIDLSGYVSDDDMVEITTDEIDTIMLTVFGTIPPVSGS